MPFEDHEERLLPEILLSLLRSPCSSHSLQLSSRSFLLTPLNTKICSHRDLKEIGQCLRNSTQHSWAHVGCPIPLCKWHWAGKWCLLMGDAFFLLAWSGKRQLLCSLLVRKHTHTSLKVCTSRLGMHRTTKWRVTPDNAEVASAEMGSNTGCHLRAASRWLVQVTLCRVS